MIRTTKNAHPKKLVNILEIIDEIRDSEIGTSANASLKKLFFASVPGITNRRNPKIPATARPYPALIPSGMYFDHSNTKPRIVSTITRIAAM